MLSIISPRDQLYIVPSNSQYNFNNYYSANIIFNTCMLLCTVGEHTPELPSQRNTSPAAAAPGSPGSDAQHPPPLLPPH